MIFQKTMPVNSDILVLGDSGYGSIQKAHANTLLPIRHKEDIAKLSEEQKAARKAINKKILSKRVKIEHVIGRIKIFKIVKETMLLRVNLICGILNYKNRLS
jgi:hypothetical protein